MDASGLRRIATGLCITAAFTPSVLDRGLERRSPDQLLERVGMRLSNLFSADAVTRLARDGGRFLAVLTAAEREALARNHLRFWVNVPCQVEIAASVHSPPFWLERRGFRSTGRVLINEDAQFRLYARRFPAGWVELGVNALDQRADAHYAVFVRAVPGGAEPVVALDRAHSQNWKQTRAQIHSSPSWDLDHPFAYLPRELLGATLLQAAHSERHDAVLAAGRVWKTHSVSGPAPDQIVVGFGENASRSLIWTWRTAPGSNANRLRIAQAGSGEAPGRSTARRRDPRAFRTIVASSESISCRSVINDPVFVRHRAQVDDLEPDTCYCYSIGNPDSNHWTDWRPIKTAPPAEKGTRFLYLGDAQTGFEGWGRLLEQAHTRHPDADFLLIAGDLVDRGNERTNWDHFFLRARNVFDRFPLMPCVGNHEYLDRGPWLYQAFFETPHNGPSHAPPDLVYSFESGDVFLAVLDSTIAATSKTEAARQAAWLDHTLKHTHARWKLAAFHHPLFPSHPWRDVPALRTAWLPVLDRHHVDLVLQGHDHAYLRTYPLNSGKRVAKGEPGTIYVIAVSGDKFVPEQPPRDYIQVGLTRTSTYQVIETDPARQRLTYHAYTEDGREVDGFVLEKKSPRPPILAQDPQVRSLIR